MPPLSGSMTIRPTDRGVVERLLRALIEQTGDKSEYSVRAEDLQRIICLMAATVVEGECQTDREAIKLRSAFLGQAIDYLANELGMERKITGVGALEAVLGTFRDGTTH